MRTIGEVLKNARKELKYSFSDVAKKTKIKKDFIKSIEKEDWENLPEYPVVSGFVKNIAEALKVDSKKATALLRRDYPPKTISVNPKPDVSKEFVWSPKLTFLTGIAVVIIAILSYLGYQYIRFVSPPELVITAPEENQEVDENTLEIIGATDTDATVTVNNQPVIVDENGNFREEIEVSKTTQEIVVVAKSRAGKETKVIRDIKVELE
jgi:cytoskeletal protein RodZ